MNQDRDLDQAAGYLSGARRVLFITGAGISADSGLPTYRGIGGLYDCGETEEGLAVESILSGEMFSSRPELTWKYLRVIEAACRKASFNRGHEVIAKLESRAKEVWVLTQNVDGFHRDAGSSRVMDIHGDLHDLACTACRYRDRVRDYSGLETVPKCPECKGLLRPRVVLFGEELPAETFRELSRQVLAGFDLVVSVGTTSVFTYIAGPVVEAKMAGKPTVEINPGDSEVSGLVDLRLRLRAAEALDELWKRLA